MEQTALLNAVLNCKDEQTLRRLNDVICSRLKAISDHKNASASAKLKIGDRVTFEGKRGQGTVRGIVSKINTKSINVATNLGGWKVSPTLLTKVG